jgi:hypothetical protein
MPTLSASEYTQYLKFKASAGSTIRPAIQTRDNVSLSQSLINANLLASQAAFVTTPPTTVTTTLSATVSAVSTTTVTAARTDILSAAVGNGTIITYTSSQPHGLSNGDVVTITGFADFAEANVTDEEVTVVDSTTFTVAVAETGTATGAGSITNRVYYTTSVAHGLVAGDVISITGITTFTASNRTVVSAPSTTTFALTSATAGTAVSGATGSITGIVYYTTSAAHGLTAGSKYLTISGLTTTIAYNHTLATVFRAPSTTVFSLQSTATGTAITDQTGVLTLTTYPNQNMAVTGLARVQGPQVVQTRSNPDARSTVSYAGTSGALSSSRVQQPGGLPGGFKSSTSTYTRLPQQAGW